jgi:dihydroorotase
MDDAFPTASWTLRGVRALDPATGSDEVRDLFCAEGRLAAEPAPGAREIDGRGLVAMPAAIDVHVHFREPGGEGAETVASGLAAAARGGVGTVVAMPNTSPPFDSPEALAAQRALAAAAPEKRVRYLLSACCTVGRAGAEPAPLEALAAAGAIAFTDDGAMVADGGVMEEVLRRAAALGLPVMDHAVVPARQGIVRDGALARSLGLRVFPDEAETEAVARDLALARRTGAHIHLQHLSAGASADLVAAARAEGVRATAEATPHHLLLACEDIPGDDASWKMNPPLGTRADRARLREAVLDGTIGCFATDHAPHPAAAKARGFAGAPFGCIGLETALAATWKAMVAESGMAPVEWARRWTAGPAAVLGMPAPSLAPGAEARLALLRPGRWTVRAEDLASRSRNCPFLGAEMPVRVEALLA